MQSVKLGKYKVAFWRPADPTRLDSLMFDRLDAATAASTALSNDGSRTLLMESVTVGDGTYSWRLLPFGNHRAFRTGAALYRYRWPLAAMLALCVMRS